MASSLAKVFTHHLPPILSLTSLILAILAFLGPVPILNTAVSLASITPSSLSFGPTRRDFISAEERTRFHARDLRKMNVEFPRDASTVDGPSVFMGLLGSCSRSSNEAPVACTNSSFSAVYDLSVLPTAAPTLELTGPTVTTPVFLLMSIIFLFLFAAHHSFNTHLSGGSRARKVLAIDRTTRAMAWMGIIGWLIGMLAAVVLRAWYGNAVFAFNNGIIAEGTSAPQLAANVGNGFTMLWISYAFAVPALLVAMVNLRNSRLNAPSPMREPKQF